MKKILHILLLILAIASPIWSICFVSKRMVFCRQKSINTERLIMADSAILQAIDEGVFPGAVLCVVKRATDRESLGKIAYLKAYGDRQILSSKGEADTIPMTTDAIFDLASLSKCVGTTLAFMRLVEDGKVRLTDRVDRYIEDFKPWDSLAIVEQPKKKRGKKQKPAEPRVVKSEHITIQHLLTHTSGLPAFIDVKQFIQEHEGCNPAQGALRDTLVRHIATEEKRLSCPGDKVKYSCLNFVILQAIIERITGCRLDAFATREIFKPLQLQNTWYNDIDSEVKPFNEWSPIVPTELQNNGEVLYGEVHDPIARIINRGISGNAGLFSTADDLARVASMLMNGGAVRIPDEGWRGKLGLTTLHSLYSERTISTFFNTPEAFAQHTRALGWDAAYDRGGCYGDLMTPHCVASHTGYTGTSMAIDYAEGVAVILLTNRTHPFDKGSLSRTRAVVTNIVMSALR